MTFSYSLECGLLYRGQIRGYLNDLKIQLKQENIQSDYSEVKSFLESEFIFRAYNLSEPEYNLIRRAFANWERKIQAFLEN